jgi:TolB-like protein/Tfp pilus assembly protein PilF
MNLTNFFAELRRRNVYKVAVAYAVMAWLLIQAGSILFPTFEAPGWVMKVFVSAIAAGFPIAIILAWAFEMTPQGMKRTENVSPNEQIPQWSRGKFAALIVSGAVVAGGLFLFQLTRPKAGPEGLLDKSIAVLPFENRSADPDNAYFADGIQDEILTRLAKIADLKVISRTSTQRYKSSPENVPEIAKQLGVAHVLEGSVQKAGEQVRVTVQLVRAANESHLWAETFDRKLTDIFAVQTEIAENITKSLRARFTDREQQAVAAKPTENPEAYEAYLRGLALWKKLSTTPEDVENTVLYFARAVELDPKFVSAWASLSVAHSSIYTESDQTPQRLAQAKQALDRARQLQPEAGGTYFAEGMYRYRGLRDYDGALAAFEKARSRSANRVEAIEFTAYVKRRQGKWDEAVALHTESLNLDPRNTILLAEASLTHRALRRFDEARAFLNRVLEIEPDSPPILMLKAETYEAEGDSETAGRLLERVPFRGQDARFLGPRVRHWMFVRQYGEAIRTLRDVLAAPEQAPKPYLPIFRVWLGMLESLAGNPDTAKTELSQARDELIALRTQGDRAARIASHLIFAYGFLGDKAGVDREAAEIQDEIEQDAVEGPGRAQGLAAARAQLGEADAAIASVTHLLKTPGEGSLTPALLRMDPLWDPLRGDPRFQKLSQDKRP